MAGRIILKDSGTLNNISKLQYFAVQAITPGSPTTVFVTIENETPTTPGILPMATTFNLVGEEGNTIPATQPPQGKN